MFVGAHIRMSAGMYVRVYVCAYVHVCVCKSVCVRGSPDVRVRAHVCGYTCVHCLTVDAAMLSELSIRLGNMMMSFPMQPQCVRVYVIVLCGFGR